MDPEKKSKNNVTLENIFIGLTIILGIIVLVNVITASAINKQVKENRLAAEEKTKPAKIELLLVTNSKCTDCFDLNPAISSLKTANVDITKESSFEFDSKEGKDLISKYQIKKVPFLIIKGDIEKFNIEGLEKREDVMILADIPPPYTNTETGKVEGLVTLFLLKDSSCTQCSTITFLVNQIKAAGVKILDEKSIEAGSAEGKQLISKYKIGFVPTMILSKDAELYPIIKEAWPQVGTQESDAFVLRLVTPPYINLTTGRLRGLVDITYLDDKTCMNCYNVSLHKEILSNEQSFGMKLVKEESLDISDAKGKELVAKYNITKIPTALLSGDVAAYPSSESLKQFFSVENDGTYIFRKTETLGTYKDLEKNEVVEVQPQ